MNNFDNFTRLYSLSKTLRFELKPIGATATNIVKDGILEDDKRRAASYLKVKKMIDCYHKRFIDERLSNCELEPSLLQSYLELYRTGKNDEKRSKEIEKIRTSLRKQVVKCLTDNEAYKRIFKKELIQKDLPRFLHMVDNGVEGGLPENKKLLEEFYSFTTYFTGFHQNRENMYSAEPQSTAIAYRLIHENLPKFIDNISVFEKIIEIPELREKIAELFSNSKGSLNANSINDIFTLDYYSSLLTQKQIAIYNMIIGGRTDNEGTKKIQGINEYVNLYNQKQKDKANKLPKLKPLFKQILSDRETISWLPESFENDSEVLSAIRKAYEEFFVVNGENICMAEQLKELLSNISQYSAEGIFVTNDTQLTNISKQISGNWCTVKNGLCKLASKAVARKKKESDDAYSERVSKFVDSQKNFSLAEINAAIQAEGIDANIQDYFANIGAKYTAEEQDINLFARIHNAYTEAEHLFKSDYKEEKKLAQSEKDVELIKNLLDTIKSLQHFIKPLNGKDIPGDKDERFYSDLLNCWVELDKFTPLYNMVRNYMTKKPYSTEKIKLNFSNPQLLNGWDVNKEKDNTTVILSKDGIYYLAIMNKRHSKSFEKKFDEVTGESYNKMEYKLLPGPNKMLPKVFFSKKGLEAFTPPAEILKIYENGTFKTGDKFNLADCHKLIDFYKDAISRHKDWSKFDFKFSATASYKDISGFYHEVESQGYRLTFRQIPASYIDELVAEGKIYLFQIYNKDFSGYSKGTPNLHTLYWKMLFDKQNHEDLVYKLNGEAEVFFRKSSIAPTGPTHPANLPIKNKSKENEKKESTFTYDLIKDRRYTVDKYQFHVPITMNFVNEGVNNINEMVRKYISKSDDLHIIGIDRGERNLLYLTVIDLKGNIKKQISLNEISNEYKTRNYHDLLEAREEERMKSRQSWKAMDSIKDLKEGYLSQVVHQITQLMLEFNAILVLEDLNLKFMQGRQKVEKSVYQKFEKMLVNKLAYLVDKKKGAQESAGLLNAMQLVNNPSDSNNGKQNGFLFYIPAWNTSKIDPVTGFTNLFSSEDLSYSSVQKATVFFGKFDSIRYNAEKDWFEFKFNYRNFTSKAEGTKEDWTLCSYGKRIRTFRNPAKNSQWDNEEIDLTTAFKALFESFGVDINSNIKNSIMGQCKDFFDGKNGNPGFCNLFKLLLQMRNSMVGTHIDYIISPVADDNGVFFDSRTMSDGLPQDADANGAYNIARKGLMMVRQIKEAENLNNIIFDLNNKAWLNFVQTKPYANK